MFAREVNPGLTGLVKKLETATKTYEDCSFRVVIVVLSDDSAMEDKLKDLAKKEDLKKVLLSIGGVRWPGVKRKAWSP